MMTDGADVLDALVAGVSIVELDPNQTGVGWSGLPNAEGVVQLDACCMHGPKKRAGGVAGIEGVRAPARVAQLVADETDHHLLVGKGAQEFARSMGIKIEEGLINETARKQWLEWKRRTDPLHYLDPKKRSQAWYEAGLQMVREGLDRRRTLLGHHQLRRRQRQRRSLRRVIDTSLSVASSCSTWARTTGPRPAACQSINALRRGIIVPPPSASLPCRRSRSAYRSRPARRVGGRLLR